LKTVTSSNQKGRLRPPHNNEKPNIVLLIDGLNRKKKEELNPAKKGLYVKGDYKIARLGGRTTCRLKRLPSGIRGGCKSDKQKKGKTLNNKKKGN